jgi:hypothetical protein
MNAAAFAPLIGLHLSIVRRAGAHQSERGEMRLELADGYALLVFPASHKLEAWRFFAPGKRADHVIFPDE